MASPIDLLFQRMQTSPRCRLLPSVGQPNLPIHFSLPPEVVRFYELCGGVEFLEKDHARRGRYRIVAPHEVVDIGMAAVEDSDQEPPLDGWFVVGCDDNSEHAVVDLNPMGYGRCYDVFHETFSNPVYSRIVALSFAEFVERLFVRGRSYWFDEGFRSYGFYGERES